MIPKKSNPPPSSTVATASPFTITRGITRKAFKIGIYGPEGIGKSSLASLCPNLAGYADIEGSADDFDIPRVKELPANPYNWALLRQWIQSLSGGINVIDSITRAEDWAAQFVIETKSSNEGIKAKDSLEDFKYKAGLQFVCDEFRKLLSDIDAAKARGASFIMIAHARINKVKNPDGSDFVRYEPRLVDDMKVSNMLQWVQFLDHLAFVDLDKNVAKGKVSGSGSRTIYLDTAPNRICKARGIPNDQIPFEPGDGKLWDLVLK